MLPSNVNKKHITFTKIIILSIFNFNSHTRTKYFTDNSRLHPRPHPVVDSSVWRRPARAVQPWRRPNPVSAQCCPAWAACISRERPWRNILLCCTPPWPRSRWTTCCGPLRMLRPLMCSPREGWEEDDRIDMNEEILLILLLWMVICVIQFLTSLIYPVQIWTDQLTFIAFM